MVLTNTCFKVVLIRFPRVFFFIEIKQQFFVFCKTHLHCSEKKLNYPLKYGYCQTVLLKIFHVLTNLFEALFNRIAEIFQCRMTLKTTLKSNQSIKKKKIQSFYFSQKVVFLVSEFHFRFSVMFDVIFGTLHVINKD